jgi:hypothetical protein
MHCCVLCGLKVEENSPLPEWGGIQAIDQIKNLSFSSKVPLRKIYFDGKAPSASDNPHILENERPTDHTAVPSWCRCFYTIIKFSMTLMPDTRNFNCKALKSS